MTIEDELIKKLKRVSFDTAVEMYNDWASKRFHEPSGFDSENEFFNSISWDKGEFWKRINESIDSEMKRNDRT